MPNDPTPYVEVKPGDLITADLFNAVQEDVKNDIAQQIQTSIGGITNVKHADDSGTITGLTVDQLTSQILEKVKAMIPGRTGYLRTFNRLKSAQSKVLKHNLGAAPVVDVYQLEYFEVVCAQGENATDAIVEWVNFYLYHESEKAVRGIYTDPNDATATAKTVTVTIENAGQQPYRVPFSALLTEFGVDTSKGATTLDELVTAFWTAMFSSQTLNDTFDPAQYCHSPWFEKCCGELRTIDDLKGRGDWDHLWFKMLPRKTINYPATSPQASPQEAYAPVASPLNINGQPVVAPAAPKPTDPPTLPATGPTQIEVDHFDLNTSGITLLVDPVPEAFVPDALKYELAAMVIMKV